MRSCHLTASQSISVNKTKPMPWRMIWEQVEERWRQSQDLDLIETSILCQPSTIYLQRRFWLFSTRLLKA
ncbi:hypothetical protein GOP47_0004795 [Adiantum capillus-veneris]|uniref:Uncharacterized protein n=1 Tax=Adiantum capillus-veneris TaxID=13818 RepID=A0A9D4ZN14_ADICA|nr:hypothetical protein GOP47_0004795 [Adiantum capillus-veneris]